MLSGQSEVQHTAEPGLEQTLTRSNSLLWKHFGVPFHFYSLDSQDHLAGPNQPLEVGSEILQAALAAAKLHGEVFVRPLSDLTQLLVIPLENEQQTGMAAVAIFATRPRSDSEAESSRARPQHESDHGIPYCNPGFLRQVGQAAQQAIAVNRPVHGRDQELHELVSQLSHNYEEITLMYQLTREARVSRSPREVHELTLTLLSEVLPAGQLVMISVQEEPVISRGANVLNPQQCRELIELLENGQVHAPLVQNHVQSKPWAKQFPGLKRLIAVPVSEAGERFGTLIAINTIDGSELGSVEASLISAVAAILATHYTNVKLFHDVEELFMGIVRALSSAIDAKDPYTCGHSERVARMAQRLGQELGLPKDQVDLLYLAGLLHDVGKIGIRDAVLCKPGRLNDEEFEHIKAHTRIGHEILSRVRQLGAVLPGVRSHHEIIDGSGYPDGLKGDEIPLMARILAVVDSYDAMSSDRCYRRGLYSERIQEIFRLGAGKQWDPNVVEALLAAHDEIAALAADRQPAAGEQRHEEQPGRSDLRRISQLLRAGCTQWSEL